MSTTAPRSWKCRDRGIRFRSYTYAIAHQQLEKPMDGHPHTPERTDD